MSLAISSCVDRVIGDDWRFTFSCSDIITGLAYDLTGYTPGGVLTLPNGATLNLIGSYVDDTQLRLGIIVFNIPRALTATFTPDETAYKVLVYLIDPANVKQTYGIIPVRVYAT